MTFVVLVADDIDDRGLEQLRQLPDFEVVWAAGDRGRVESEIPRADALLVRSATRVTEDLLRMAKRLKVIGRAGIGVDNIDVDAATRRGIAVLNVPGGNTISAAEHTIALLLALVRRIPWAVESMRAGQWDRKTFGGTELRGKTFGLIGLGRIGMHVASVGRAFGMRLIAHDPFMSESRAKEIHVELTSLEDLLKTADVVSLHAPLTDDTYHLLDEQRLSLMKPSAVIINTARGALVDADALCAAVNEGRLAGAALDVFDPEPLAADAALRATDRIILTPHLAASTEEAQQRVAVEICQSVRRGLESGDVGGAVNVPGVSSDLISRAREPMQLALRLGRLAGSLSGGPIDSMQVHFGGKDDGSAKPVTIGALQGVLESMGVSPVSLVNATFLAEERNIALSRSIGRPVGGFETSIGIVLQSGDRRVEVVGALDAGRVRRVIQIDDYAVDIPAEGAVLILRNRDVPGVIGRVGTLLGAAAVNIAFYHQSRRSPSNGEALAAIAVDEPPSRKVLEDLARVDDVKEIRLARLDNEN